MRWLGRTKARPYSEGGGAGLEPIIGDDEWSEEGELGVEELEGETVVGCGAVGGDSCTVCLCGVAFVAVPAILRIFGGDCAHILIAVCLCED